MDPGVLLRTAAPPFIARYCLDPRTMAERQKWAAAGAARANARNEKSSRLFISDVFELWWTWRVAVVYILRPLEVVTDTARII